MQTSSHSSQAVVDDMVNEAGASTMAPGRSTVLCCWMDQGYRWLVLELLLQPEPASGFKSAAHDVSFSCSYSRCQWYMSILSSILLQGI